MDFATIEQFGYLCKYGNLSVAATEMHVDQSSLSRMLTTMEREIGTKLYDRSKTPMELTPEGEVALDYAGRITSAYYEMMIEIKKLRESKSKIIRVSGLLESSMANYINDAMREFRTKQQDIRIKPTSTGLINPFNALRDGKIDVLFECFSEMIDIHDLESIPLHRERAYVVLDIDHALAGRDTLYVEELRDTAFVSHVKNTDYALRKHFQSLCRRHGFAGKLTTRTLVSRSELFLLDFEDMAVMLPESMLSSMGIGNLDNFVAIPVVDADADYDLRAFFSPIQKFQPVELINYLSSPPPPRQVNQARPASHMTSQRDSQRVAVTFCCHHATP